MERIGRGVHLPLVANMVEGGRTPILSRAELESGWASSSRNLPNVRASGDGRGAQSVFGELRDQGSRKDWNGKFYGFDAFSRLMGFERVWDFERRHADPTPASVPRERRIWVATCRHASAFPRSASPRSACHPLRARERSDLHHRRAPADREMNHGDIFGSPERAETIVVQPASHAASKAAFASVNVPIWFGLISAALAVCAASAGWMRRRW